MRSFVVVLSFILTVGIMPRVLNVTAASPVAVLMPANIELSENRILAEWYSGFLSGCLYAAVSVLGSMGVTPESEAVIGNCLKLSIYAIRNDLHMDVDWQPTFEELKTLAEQKSTTPN